MSYQVPWDILNVIKYRVDFPSTIPAGSWWTSQQADIRILLEIIEKMEKDNGKIRSR